MTEGAGVLDGRYAWFRLAVTLAIATVGNVGMWAIIVVMPAMQVEFGLNRGEASLPYAATMVGFALGNLVIGRAVDRYGIVRGLIGATLLIGGGFALAAQAGSVLLLTAVQFAIGLGTGAAFGPLLADISHWFEKRRGLAVSIAACGNYLSGAVWPLLLAGVLADQGWRAVYLALAVLVVGAILPLSLLLRRRVPALETARAESRAAGAAKAAGLSPRALTGLLFVAGIACCVAMSMPQVHIVAYCVDLGYGPAVGAEMLAAMLLGGVVSRLASGFLADWLGGVPTVLIGSTLQMLALMLYLPFDGLVALFVVSLIFGLAQGGIVPGYAVIVREYLPPREAGARVGLVMGATILGMALGGWLSGWIFDLTGSYRAAFLNGIAWNLLNIAVLAALLWRSQRGQGLAAMRAA